MIKDLKDCTVYLLDHSAQITVDRCKGTKFFIGPVKASVFFRDCSDCQITVACAQFRCRDLRDSVIYLYTPNDPIIESSSALSFAPFNLKYPLLESHSTKANIIGESKDEDGNIQKKVNKWNQVFDFTKQAQEDNFKFVNPN